MPNSTELKTVVLYGSARRDRQGIKAARFVVRQLEKRDHDVTLVDSATYKLPMLDWMYKEYEPGQAPEAMQRVAEVIALGPEASKDSSGILLGGVSAMPSLHLGMVTLTSLWMAIARRWTLFLTIPWILMVWMFSAYSMQ